MLARLLYLGLAHPEESPRSVLLRTITHNGYRNIFQFAKYLGLESLQPLALQMGDSALVDQLKNEAGGLKDRFVEMFYRQKTGITNEEPIEIMGTSVPISALLATKHKVCPECLLDGHMRAIQDIEWVDVCPYHDCRYLTACPDCEKPFNWTRMRFNACSCGFEMNYKNTSEIKDDSSGPKVLLNMLRTHDSEGIIRIHRLLNALRFNEHSELSERINLFNHAAMIATNLKVGMQNWLNEKKIDHNGLPDRVLLSRFIVIQDPVLQSTVEKILQDSDSELLTICGNCNCKNESLSATETEALFGISNQTLLKLAKSGKVMKRRVGSRGVEYPIDSICNFYRSFMVQKAPDKELRKYPLCETNNFSLGLNSNLDQLIAGKKLLIQADLRKPLSEFIVIDAAQENTEQHAQTPAGFLTVAETAKRLDVYPDVVRRALKAGYITQCSAPDKSKAVFISINDVEVFEKEYVFISTLSKLYATKKTAFSAQLATAGIHPISGPGIDSGLVPMYRWANLKGHNLTKIAATEHFQTRAGRKKGDPPLYDTQEWMRSSEVCKDLQVNAQALEAIEQYGLLEGGKPSGREADNTRFYKTKSVITTKKWLDSSVSVQQLAQSENTNVRMITIRFIKSGFLKPLEVNGKALVSGPDAERIRAHHKKFCTCSEAAKYIGAQQRHFYNMIKLGKIHPASIIESEVNTITLLQWQDVKNFH